jgi:hypothetical protein
MSRATKQPLETPYVFPAFRRPTRTQILNMLPAIMRRARLYRDPFTALHLLKQRNPDNIYKCVYLLTVQLTH